MPPNDNPSNDLTPPQNSAAGIYQTPEDVDAIFECLASRRRRLLIECLSEKSEPVVVEELVQHVSEREDRRTAGTPRDGRLDDATIALHHTHLPKMDEAGVVEVDRETKTVQKGDRFYIAESLLKVV